MAIDTAEKRRSAAGVAFWVAGPGVTPNVVHDLEWRQESGWGYSGIPTAGPTPPTPGGTILQSPTLGGVWG